MVRVGVNLVAAILASAAQPGIARSHDSATGGLAAQPVHAASSKSASAGESGSASDAVVKLLHWVELSSDNDGLPFMIIDKLGARIFVFDAEAHLLGTAPALIGIATGDNSAPGVGNLRLGKIPVEQRTTPAGRFIARFGPAKGHPPVLWVDYGDAISLHPVVTKNRKERRLERIKSADADEHQISFGCINVPASFYTRIVKPQFKSKDSSGVVYILPDTKSLADVFPAMVAQGSAEFIDAGDENGRRNCGERPRIDRQDGSSNPIRLIAPATVATKTPPGIGKQQQVRR